MKLQVRLPSGEIVGAKVWIDGPPNQEVRGFFTINSLSYHGCSLLLDGRPLRDGGEPCVRADLCDKAMELLEAAREALDALELYDMEGLGVCDQLKAAIAKAEGKEATTAPQEGQGGK